MKRPDDRVSSTSEDLDESGGTSTSTSTTGLGGVVVETRWLGPPLVLAGRGANLVEVRFTSRRALKVLALLSLQQGRGMPRDRVLEAIWPEVDPALSQSRLHPTLTLLRRSLASALGPAAGRPSFFVHSEGGVLRLDPLVTWRADLTEFSGRLQAADEATPSGRWTAVREALRQGWRLFRGPLCDGWDDVWLREERETWRGRRVELLRRLADVEVWLGHLDSAADALQSILVEEPLSESDHVALLRVLAAQGRRDLVRRQYERLARGLIHELGVEPLPATTREYQRLMTRGVEEDAAGGGSESGGPGGRSAGPG